MSSQNLIACLEPLENLTLYSNLGENMQEKNKPLDSLTVSNTKTNNCLVL